MFESALSNRSRRSHLSLVVSNSTPNDPSSVTAESPSSSPVRLARSAESTACAEALVDSYHRERLITPFRSVIRVVPGVVAQDVFTLAIEELECRGWTITSAEFSENELHKASALWLRPYC